MENLDSYILSVERFLSSFWDLVISSSVFFRVVVFTPFIFILCLLIYSYVSKRKIALFEISRKIMLKKVPFTSILLADDDPHVTKFFSFFLKKRGIDVTVATNGKEALDIWMKNPNFDIVVADINMPKMSGVDLGAVIYKECPVVLMSADDQKVLEERGDLNKCHGYFCKESKSRDFLTTTRKAYDSWQLENNGKAS
ncbi:MAG: response regulator [Bdellovibrionota bacterium]|nr:response regulator [Bdellovibrionota bacterium]